MDRGVHGVFELGKLRSTAGQRSLPWGASPLIFASKSGRRGAEIRSTEETHPPQEALSCSQRSGPERSPIGQRVTRGIRAGETSFHRGSKVVAVGCQSPNFCFEIRSP
ncbi:MAG: hypothetical protein LBB18_00810, partial [Puniceicoccales bacterium]|nr:hypothetical protein [Puniceicoccales bacterium]